MRGSPKSSGRESAPVRAPDHAGLEDRLARVDPLIEKATEALQTFYREDKGQFLRENVRGDPTA